MIKLVSVNGKLMIEENIEKNRLAKVENAIFKGTRMFARLNNNVVVLWSSTDAYSYKDEKIGEVRLNKKGEFITILTLKSGTYKLINTKPQGIVADLNHLFKAEKSNYHSNDYVYSRLGGELRYVKEFSKTQREWLIGLAERYFLKDYVGTISFHKNQDIGKVEKMLIELPLFELRVWMELYNDVELYISIEDLDGKLKWDSALLTGQDVYEGCKQARRRILDFKRGVTSSFGGSNKKLRYRVDYYSDADVIDSEYFNSLRAAKNFMNKNSVLGDYRGFAVFEDGRRI